MTGSLLAIDIRGRDGRTLQDKWAEGPRTYLGLAVAGFPNLFAITGPGSPSVLSNMIVSIEQHVDWIADCLAYLRERHRTRIEATARGGGASGCSTSTTWATPPSIRRRTPGTWGRTSPASRASSCPTSAGSALYRQKCDEVAAKGYEGFQPEVAPLTPALSPFGGEGEEIWTIC